MTQLDMFVGNHAPKQRERTARRVEKLMRPSIQARFDLFHEKNPHVLVELLRLARARLARGETRVGSKALWEELREWIRVEKAGSWKLDNSLTALYGRALIAAEPALDGVIELRRRKAP